jgi:outer membrane protein OmpA-like peptidoglycan-associated protein
MPVNSINRKATWHHRRALVCCSALGLMLAACSNAPPSSSRASYPNTATVATPQEFVVHFNTGEAALTPDDRQTLGTVAATKRAEPSARLTVVGKADTVGGAADNLSLSERRAHAVRNDLVAAGVSPDEIQVSWTGEGQPNVPTGNHVSEPRNRAVHITVQ